jgi:hypothetical protein
VWRGGIERRSEEGEEGDCYRLVVTGLRVEDRTLLVETIARPGTGRLRLTGRLGDVCISPFASSCADLLTLDSPPVSMGSTSCFKGSGTY